MGNENFGEEKKLFCEMKNNEGRKISPLNQI